MEKPFLPVAVVMRRRAAQSRWVDHVWEPVQVQGDPGGETRRLHGEAEAEHWLHPGFRIVLHRDEAEGYYLNCSATEPKVFVLWRMEGDRALPLDVTASSEEAGRWLDAGHNIDGVRMSAEIFAWVGEYVEKNYKPQPKKRIKPRSFQHPKDRV